MADVDDADIAGGAELQVSLQALLQLRHLALCRRGRQEGVGTAAAALEGSMGTQQSDRQAGSARRGQV
jgi:hypothetical protein